MAPPGKDEKNFMYQKNDDCHNHRLCVWNSGCVHAGEFKCRNVPCVSRTGFFHFGVCRSSDSSIQAARLIAACDLAPYCQRIASAFSPGHDSPSNDRFSPHAGIPPHGKQYFRITATFGILPHACNLKCTDCNPAMDSFRVRDSHPIPLFSEQACVSDCSGRACATKAMVCNFYQCAVVSCESSFAKLAFFGKRCIRSFHCFL